MDYKALFKEKALEHFKLNADDYFEPFSLEDFLYNIEFICKNANDEYLPKRGINRLVKLSNEYSFICDNPTVLTEQDQLAIEEMKEYLKNNKGHSFGYFSYRKQFYEEEVGRFYELSLANKMTILANKEFILEQIQNKIKFMYQCEYENKYIKKKIITPKIKLQKLAWANKKVLCVCGKEYSKSGKFLHCKTKHHVNFIKENEKKEPIVIDGGNITLTIDDNLNA